MFYWNWLQTEMASQGYFVAAVEHRDGSAAATMIIKDGEKEFIYERKLQPDEKVSETLVHWGLIKLLLKLHYAVGIVLGGQANLITTTKWLY